jgi:hypothetical protein
MYSFQLLTVSVEKLFGEQEPTRSRAVSQLYLSPAGFSISFVPAAVIT